MVAIDSGSTYMSVPNYMAKELRSVNFPLSNTEWPCDKNSTYGNITLVIGGKHYDMPPSDWQEAPVIKNVTTVPATPSAHAIV